MFRPTSTFWRRFWLLEKSAQWPASRVRRQPELAYIPPTDPYFAWPTRMKRIMCRALPDYALGFAMAILYAWLVSTAYVAAIDHHTAPTRANPIPLRPLTAFVVVALITQYLGMFLIIRWWNRGWMRRHNRRFRTELRRRGIPICLACGYVAGAMDAPSCPECGAAHAPG